MYNYSPDELDVQFNVPAMARVIIPKLEESIEQYCDKLYCLPDSLKIPPVPVASPRKVASNGTKEQILVSIESYRGKFIYCQNSVSVSSPMDIPFWRALGVVMLLLDENPEGCDEFLSTVFPGCDLQLKAEDWMKLIDNAVEADSSIAEFVNSRICVDLPFGQIQNPNRTRELRTSWHCLKGNLYAVLGPCAIVNCGPLQKFQSAFNILSQNKCRRVEIEEIVDAEFLNSHSELQGIEILESPALGFQYDGMFFLLNSESMSALASWFAESRSV